jgi:DNA photolyase
VLLLLLNKQGKSHVFQFNSTNKNSISTSTLTVPSGRSNDIVIFLLAFLVLFCGFLSAESFSLSMSAVKKHKVAIHWFRKGLRLHDNPSLLEACTTSSKVYPIFIIDPWFAKPDKVGINRYSFLLESLTDLDKRWNHG